MQHNYTKQQDRVLVKLIGESQEEKSTGAKITDWNTVCDRFNDRFEIDVSKAALKGRLRRLKGAGGGLTNTEDIIHAAEVLDPYDETDAVLERLVQPVFPDMKVPEFEWEQFYEVAERLAELEGNMSPTIGSAIVHIPTDKPIAIMHTADWHLCSRWMAFKTFRALLDLTMETDRVYWGTYGDETENFPMKWLPPAAQQVLRPQIQRKMLKAIINKLTEKGKVLWSFWGNHSFEERDIGENLTEPMWMGKVPYFHGKGVIQLKIGKDLETAEEYVIFGSHNLKGTSIYNPNHSQMRALLWEVPQADFIVTAHKHKYSYQEVPHHENAYLAGLNKNRTSHLVQIGSAKSGPDHYTIRGWSQGHFEWPIFLLYPNEHKIKRCYDFKDLEYFLDTKIDPKLLERLEEAAEAEGV